MSVVRLRPGPVSGTARAPPSKSYTHRALVIAHLSRRSYRVENPLVSDDTVRTAGALRALGSRVEADRDGWSISPDPAGTRPRRARIDCGESGTTLRFVTPLAALSDRAVTLVGRGRLPLRPMGALVDALRTLGVSAQLPGNDRTLPLVVKGPMHGGVVRVRGSESSQFVSALLLVLPTLSPDSVLRVVGGLVSEPYVEATLAVLRASRVRVISRGSRYSLSGGQKYRGTTFHVPGDASSAAYLWAAAAIAGGRVTVKGVSDRWPQADLAILRLLERYGADVRRDDESITVRGNGRRPFLVDLTDTPDLYPLAGVLAAAAPGESRLVGASHVAHKESDRRGGTAGLATAMGATVKDRAGALVVRGTKRPTAFALRGLLDHRIVMSAAVGALAASGPSSVADGRAVGKSYPGFWETLRAIAGKGSVT
jgi:3-phosphoshikimate 1-carboxyvinyltransferase